MPHRERIPLVCFLSLIGTCFLLCTFGQAQQHGRRGYQCLFSGMAPKTSAKAIFRPIENGRRLRYTVKVKNIEDITMAHLHLGTVGDFGSPVVWLYPPSPPPKLKAGSFTGVLAEGTISAEDLIGPLRDEPLAELIKHMEKGHTYANIHTEEYPRGEICGPVRLIQSEERPSETNRE